MEIFDERKDQHAMTRDKLRFLITPNAYWEIDCEHKGLPRCQAITDPFSEEAI